MKFLQSQKNQSTQNGFTIIETLVAISILLVATTGPLSFAQNGLKASFLARDQVVAFYLAQDVVETIKNIRDNTALSGGTNWLGGLGACNPGSEGSTAICSMDTAETLFNIESCLSGTCSKLYFDTVTKQFVKNSGTNRIESPFTRTIFVTNLVDDREAQIVVEIAWQSQLVGTKKILVQENIYNWVPNYAP